MITIYLIIVSFLVVAAWLSQKIDFPGALAGGCITYILLVGVGWLGLWLIGVFFVSGTLASVWKLNEKQQYGIAEKNHAKRGVRNVLANTILPTLLGFLSYLYPACQPFFEVLIAAGFASATSDTLSSELGNVYGSRYYNIITLKVDRRGKDGVISLEGTFFGILGSLLIAVAYALNREFSPQIIIIVLAGMIGNMADSILGATLQQKGYLNNHTVNIANTLIACLLAFILQRLFI